MNRPRIALLASLMLGAQWAGLKTARAQSDTREIVAEAEFVEGVRLMKDGALQAALACFQESQRLSPASGTLLDMAYCEAQLGHLARAWFLYRQALALAEASGKKDHARLAHEEQAKLERSLGWLSLGTSTPDRAWQLTLDGESLPNELAGVAFPVDPGDHVLVVSVSGTQRSRRELHVASGEKVVVELVEPEPSVRAPLQAETPPAQRTPHVNPPSTPHGARRLSVVLAAAGGAGIATGIGLFLHARLAYDSATCPDNRCSGSARDARVSARNESFVSYGVSAAGAALFGIGAALWFSSPPGHEQRAPVGQSALLLGGELGPWSVGVQHRF